MTEAIITTHAEKRIRQRLGLPKRAVKRMANGALNNKFDRRYFNGSLRKYLDSVYHRKNEKPTVKLKDFYMFIFQGDSL